MRVLTAAVAAVALTSLGGCARDNGAPLTPYEPLAVDPAAMRSHRAIDTVATGLDNPRGLAFGPDGGLYVAEGGTGGTASTVGQCEQVPAPIGPYTGGYTARISKIDRTGLRTTVVDGLPSSQTSPATGGLVSGVADLTFIGHTLYAVLAGAGCSHGIPDVPNAVIRVKRNGGWEVVADLSAFVAANPVQHPEADDFEPDGTWYSLVAAEGDLYTVEPNHGEVDRIRLHRHHHRPATVERLVDVSATEGHIVPTALAYHHGTFYFGNLTTFPLVPGAASIYKVSHNGTIRGHFGLLTGVLGLAFDRQGRLYALENTVCPTADPCGPTPGTGAVVRVERDGDVTMIASGLVFPTGMTLGPEGALYVSVNGFGFPPGAGQVLRILIDGRDRHDDRDEDSWGAHD